jgi:hypothetical protein
MKKKVKLKIKALAKAKEIPDTRDFPDKEIALSKTDLHNPVNGPAFPNVPPKDRRSALTGDKQPFDKLKPSPIEYPAVAGHLFGLVDKSNKRLK